MPLDDEDDDLFYFDAKPIKRKSLLESSIEAHAVAYATARGWLHKKIGTGAWPDHMFLKDGVVIFVEFKQYGKTPRPNQAKRLKEIRDAGFQALVIDKREQVHDVFRA